MPDIIDELQLKIEAHVRKTNDVKTLTNNLVALSSAIHRLSGMGRNIDSLGKSLNTLGSANLSRTIENLERLGKVDLSNLKDKQIKLDIAVSGMNETERMKVAMQKTASEIHKITDEITKDIAGTYNIKGAKRSDLDAMLRSYGKAFAKTGSTSEAMKASGDLFTYIAQNSKVASSYFMDGLTDMKNEYKSFLSYLQNNKIKFYSGDDNRKYNETLTPWERKAYFNQKSGVKVDEIWDDMINVAPGFLADLRNETADVGRVIEKIKIARDQLATKPISEYSSNYQDKFYSNMVPDVSATMQRLRDNIEKSIADNAERSATKIPLNLDIDQNRFEQQIADAVDKARQKDYGKIDVKLGIDTTAFKNEITSTMTGMDLSNVQSITTELKSMLETMQKIATIDTNSNGTTAFVKSLASLSKNLVSLSNSSRKLDSTKLDQFTNSAKRMISELENTSDGVKNATRLLYSVASISRYSGQMETAASNLPLLADGIRDFTEAIENMPVSGKVMQLVTAINELSKKSARVNGNLSRIGEGTNRSNIALTTLKTVVKSTVDGFKTWLSVLKKVSTALIKLGGSVISHAVSGIRNLVARLKEANAQRSSIDGLHFSVKTLLGTLIGYRGLTGLFNWSKEAVTAGANLTEINHIIESVFGEDMVDTVENWARNAIDSFGIASTAAKQYAGTLTAMFQASNVGVKESAKMGMDLVELAGDLSAFYNIDTEAAYSKIKSGMAGMVRPLRDLGIDLSVASLKEYALAQGIEKSYTNMTQAEKVMLRYKYLMEKTATQQGDFSRTSLSLANSLRTLKAYLSEITTQIGVGFAAALRHVIVALNSVMQYVLKAANAFATFMQTIFGKYKGGASGMALDMSSIMTDLDSSAYGADDLADGLDDASENAKELKKTLSVLSFDELNQLSKPTESTSKDKSSGSGDTGGLTDFGDGMLDWGIKAAEASLTEFEKFFSEWAKRIKSAFDAKNWKGLGQAIAWGINKGIDELYELLDPKKVADKVNPFVDAFAETLNSLIDAINWNKIGRTIGRGIDDIVNTVNRLIDPVTGINWSLIGSKLADGLNGLFDEVDWDALGTLFANKLNILWNTAKGFVENFNWSKLGESLGKFANNLATGINYDAIISTINNGLRGLSKAVSKFAKTFDWKGYGELLAEKANLLVSGLPVGEILQAIGDLANGIKDTLLAMFDPEKGIDFGEIGHRLGASIKRAIRVKADWEGIGTLLGNMWSSAWKLLISFVSTIEDKSGQGQTIGAGINKALTKAVNTAKENLGDGTAVGKALGNFAKQICQNIIDALGDVSLWYGIGESIGNAIGGLLATEGLGEKAGEAVNKITTSLVALMAGAIDAMSEDKEKIGTNITKFFRTLDWGAILTAAAPFIGLKLAAAIPGLTLLGVSAAVKAKIFGLMTTAGSTAVTEAAKSGSIVTAAKGFGETLAGFAGTELVAAAAAWVPVAGVLGVALIGAIYGNTPEGKAEMERCRAALDKDLRESANNVENIYYGTGTSIEDTTKRAAENTIRQSERTKEQLAIDLTAIQRSGKITEEELTKYIKGIYSGDEELIQKSQELCRKWIDGEEKMVNSSSTSHTKIGGKLSETKKALEEWSKTHTDAKTAQIKSLQDADTQIEASKNVSTTAMNEEKLAMKQWEAQTKSSTEAVEKLVTGAITKTKDAIKSADYSAELKQSVTDSYNKSAEANQQTAYKGGQNIVAGTTNGLTDASTVSTLKKTVQNLGKEVIIKTLNESTGVASPSTLTKGTGKYIIEGLDDGMKSKFSSLKSTVNDVVNIVKKIITNINAKHSSAYKSGEGVTNKMISGLHDGLNNFSISDFISGIFGDAEWKFQELQDNFYMWGQSLTNALAEGMRSITPPKLQYYISDWSYHDLGNGGYTHTPVISPYWAAAGGLFTQTTIVGLGEAGKEAVLPLENKKTMGMIADAITNNSKAGIGMSKEEMTDAVAMGVAMAMAQNPQVAEIVVHSILQTDDVEIARATNRGQMKLDQRYNPTAQFGF